MVATCNQCGFQVSWDEAGEAVMADHLKTHTLTPGEWPVDAEEEIYED